MSLLSRIVFGGDEGHLADGGRHRFLPDFDLDGCSVLSKCCIHVSHGNVLFQAWRRAAAGHLTWHNKAEQTIDFLVKCLQHFLAASTEKIKKHEARIKLLGINVGPILNSSKTFLSTLLP